MALPKLQQAYGNELQFFTNHIGHFILVTGLIEALAAERAYGAEQQRAYIRAKGRHRIRQSLRRERLFGLARLWPVETGQSSLCAESWRGAHRNREDRQCVASWRHHDQHWPQRRFAPGRARQTSASRYSSRPLRRARRRNAMRDAAFARKNFRRIFASIAISESRAPWRATPRWPRGSGINPSASWKRSEPEAFGFKALSGESRACGAASEISENSHSAAAAKLARRRIR